LPTEERERLVKQARTRSNILKDGLRKWLDLASFNSCTSRE